MCSSDLAVHPSVPVRTIKELIALAKSKPGEISFASNGTGTISHLTGELFQQQSGVRMLHVPYKGAAPAVIDVLAGQVTFLFAAYPSIATQERAGKLRALAVTSLKRMQLLPQVPTVAESGLPGFDANQWWACYGPAGMPAAIVVRLEEERRHRLRLAVRVNGDEGGVRRVRVLAHAGEDVLRLDAHADFQRRAPDPVHARLHDDQLADHHRLAEIHPVNRGGDAGLAGVPHRADGRGLVEHRQQRAAEHVAAHVLVLRHHQRRRLEPRVTDGMPLGRLGHGRKVARPRRE